MAAGSFLNSLAVTQIISCSSELCFSLREVDFVYVLCKDSLFNCLMYCFRKYFLKINACPMCTFTLFCIFISEIFQVLEGKLVFYIENGFECL